MARGAKTDGARAVRCCVCYEAWQRVQKKPFWTREDGGEWNVGRAGFAVAPDKFDWGDPYALMAVGPESAGFVCPECYGALSGRPHTTVLLLPGGKKATLHFESMRTAVYAWAPVNGSSDEATVEQMQPMLKFMRSCTHHQIDGFRWGIDRPAELVLANGSKWGLVFDGWHSVTEQSGFSRAVQRLSDEAGGTLGYPSLLCFTMGSNVLTAGVSYYVPEEFAAAERCGWRATVEQELYNFEGAFIDVPGDE
jgi:hypothetical protein